MTNRVHGDPEAILRRLILENLIIDGAHPSPTMVGGFPEVGTHYSPYYIGLDTISGPADRFTQEPSVQVDVWAPRRSTAKSVAFALQLLLLRYPWSVQVESQMHIIDMVTCDIVPTSMPWEDQEIRRQGAQYTLTLRR